MKLLALSLMACLLLTSQASAADKDELRGVWIVVSNENKGKKVEHQEFDLLRFSGDKLIAESSDKKTVLPSNYRTDKSKSPKHIDITIKSIGTGKDDVSHGIYKIKGDTLTICIGKPRPTAFDSKKSGLIVCKRKKK